MIGVSLGCKICQEWTSSGYCLAKMLAFLEKKTPLICPTTSIPCPKNASNHQGDSNLSNLGAPNLLAFTSPPRANFTKLPSHISTEIG